MKRAFRFGTDGWRGVIAEDFTFENLELITQATAEVFIEREDALKEGVSVGYDTRFLSDKFAHKAAQVMVANGIPVRIASSPITTPALSWDVVNNGSAWGVMITASHNPSRFNGFKIKTRKGASAPDTVTKAIEDKANSGKLRVRQEETSDLLTEEDMRSPYLKRVSSLVDWSKIEAVVSEVVSDPLYGAVNGDFLRLLQNKTSLRVRGIHLCHNPGFGGLDPEPIPRNLHDLMREVLSGSYPALGVAMDGDGDRLGMVDENGSWVNPHQVLSLLLLYLTKEKGLNGQVVKSFSTTMLIEHICQEMGLECVETGIGFKYIAPHMKEKPTLIAGEESGGVAFGFHIPERDGVLSGLMVLEMLGTWGISLRDALKRMERRYGPYLYKRIDISMPINEGRRVVESLKTNPPDKIGGIRVVEMRDKDGVKLVLQGGAWLLVRASGTEPLLRLYAEAPKERELERILNDGREACRSALSR